ncbi:MAG: SOS response-associated peptidase [Saprospiraceae bacterium]|nr:SOS response-associated peptidase [Saprospiraceae bacterium]
MCGRSSLTKTEKEIEKRFQATFYSDELERYNPLPNYNVAPTHYHPVIINKDVRHLHLFKWGLIPSWSKDPKMSFSMINARAETLMEKPAFRNIISQKRCLVPLDGFYEWKTINGEKIPYRIQTMDQDIFAAAGLWEEWQSPEGNKIYTFTIITVEANDYMKILHERMPAILLRDEENLWIDNNIPTKELLSLLKPYPSENTKAYKVDKAVNNVRNNYKELIQEVA